MYYALDVNAHGKKCSRVMEGGYSCHDVRKLYILCLKAPKKQTTKLILQNFLKKTFNIQMFM